MSDYGWLLTAVGYLVVGFTWARATYVVETIKDPTEDQGFNKLMVALVFLWPLFLVAMAVYGVYLAVKWFLFHDTKKIREKRIELEKENYLKELDQTMSEAIKSRNQE